MNITNLSQRGSIHPEAKTKARGRYDVFISYSHRSDRQLARSLERALWTFGRTWYQVRGIHTYRDETNLAAEPDLWPAIERAVKQSSHLVLLASPNSAVSEWVPKEVKTCVDAYGAQSLCIVQTDGVLPWTDKISAEEMLVRKDAALSRSVWDLLKLENSVPLVVDLRSFRNKQQYELLSDPEYLSGVAAIAARVLNVDKEIIWGEYHNAQRRRTIFLGTVSLAIGVLAVFALWQSHIARVQRDNAETQRKEAVRQAAIADARRLAAEAELAFSRDHVAAFALAIQGWDTMKIPETRLAVARTFPEFVSKITINSPVMDLAYSPDGSRAIVAGKGGKSYLWKLGANQLVSIPAESTNHPVGEMNSAPANLATFSPDGNVIVTVQGESESTIHVWNARTGDFICSAKGPLPRVVSIEIPATGNRVIATGQDGTAHVWDLKTGEKLETYQKIVLPVTHPDPDVTWRENIANCQDSPDGKYTVTFDVSAPFDQIEIWNRENKGREAVFTGKISDGTGAFSPDSQRILTFDGTDATISCVKDGKVLISLQGHDDEVTDASFSPDGNWVLTASSDGTVRIWSAVTGRLDIVLQGNAGHVQYDLDPNSRFVSSNPDAVTRAVFSPDGLGVLLGRANGTVELWTLAVGQVIATSTGPKARLLEDEYSGENRRIVTHGDGKTAQIWSATDAQHFFSFTNANAAVVSGRNKRQRPVNIVDEQPVNSARFSVNGKWVVTADHDGTARIWDASTSQMLEAFNDTNEPDAIQYFGVHDAAFSPDDRRVIVGGEWEAVRVWDKGTGKLVFRLHTAGRNVEDAFYSPDGRRILTYAHDETADCTQLWTDSGETVAMVFGHTADGPGVFSSDGKWFLTSSYFIRVWRTLDGQLVATLSAQGWPHDNMAVFSPDGRQILCTGESTNTLIQRIVTLKELDQILDGQTIITNLAMARDSHRSP